MRRYGARRRSRAAPTLAAVRRRHDLGPGSPKRRVAGSSAAAELGLELANAPFGGRARFGFPLSRLGFPLSRLGFPLSRFGFAFRGRGIEVLALGVVAQAEQAPGAGIFHHHPGAGEALARGAPANDCAFDEVAFYPIPNAEGHWLGFGIEADELLDAEAAILFQLVIPVPIARVFGADDFDGDVRRASLPHL